MRSSDSHALHKSRHKVMRFTFLADIIRLVYKHINRIITRILIRSNAFYPFNQLALEPSNSRTSRLGTDRRSSMEISSCCGSSVCVSLTRLPSCLRNAVTRGDHRGSDAATPISRPLRGKNNNLCKAKIEGRRSIDEYAKLQVIS